jgi:predicted nucleic acid-binding protein
MNGLVLIDTDILIDTGRNVSQAIEYLQQLETRSTLAVCIVTKMELIVGCKNKSEIRKIQRFLERFDIINLNEQISELAVSLLQEHRLSHGLLIADALIAATALHFALPFVTKNQKHYRFLPDLILVTYS